MEQNILPLIQPLPVKSKDIFEKTTREHRGVCSPLQTSQNQNLIKLQFLIVTFFDGLLVIQN